VITSASGRVVAVRGPLVSVEWDAAQAACEGCACARGAPRMSRVRLTEYPPAVGTRVEAVFPDVRGEAARVLIMPLALSLLAAVAAAAWRPETAAPCALAVLSIAIARAWRNRGNLPAVRLSQEPTTAHCPSDNH